MIKGVLRVLFGFGVGSFVSSFYFSNAVIGISKDLEEDILILRKKNN